MKFISHYKFSIQQNAFQISYLQRADHFVRYAVRWLWIGDYESTPGTRSSTAVMLPRSLLTIFKYIASLIPSVRLRCQGPVFLLSRHNTIEPEPVQFWIITTCLWMIYLVCGLQSIRSHDTYYTNDDLLPTISQVVICKEFEKKYVYIFSRICIKMALLSDIHSPGPRCIQRGRFEKLVRVLKSNTSKNSNFV